MNHSQLCSAFSYPGCLEFEKSIPKTKAHLDYSFGG